MSPPIVKEVENEANGLLGQHLVLLPLPRRRRFQNHRLPPTLRQRRFNLLLARRSRTRPLTAPPTSRAPTTGGCARGSGVPRPARAGDAPSGRRNRGHPTARPVRRGEATNHAWESGDGSEATRGCDWLQRGTACVSSRRGVQSVLLRSELYRKETHRCTPNSRRAWCVVSSGDERTCSRRWWTTEERWLPNPRSSRTGN